MIFVIIGLIILLVSFVIALQSLVREQNKDKPFSDNVHGDNEITVREKVNMQAEDYSGGQLTGEGIKTATQKADQEIADRSELRKGIRRELFPWESDFLEDSAEQNEAEREKIAYLKSQLAQLKAAKATLSTTVNEKSIDVAEDEIVQPRKGLSGVISIRELRKRAA